MNPLFSSLPVLSLNQFDDQGEYHELYVNTFSDHIEKHHSHVLVPHRHDFYLLVVFTSGSGFHEINFQRHSIEKGAVFFMQPGHLHHWEFSEDTEGFVVLHTGEFFEQHIRSVGLEKFPFFQSGSSFPKLNISDNDFYNITILEKIFSEFEGNENFKHLKAATQLCQLYIDFARLYTLQNSVSIHKNTLYSSKFRELEAFINEHFVTQKGVEFYANELNISSRHLNRICQQITGKTFSQTITERVMLEARHLLSSSDANFNEIASQLGYEEYSYFSKLFKQYCGVSPKEFRESYR